LPAVAVKTRPPAPAFRVYTTTLHPTPRGGCRFRRVPRRDWQQVRAIRRCPVWAAPDWHEGRATGTNGPVACGPLSSHPSAVARSGCRPVAH